ncbi:hypothetical protein [Aliivibrio fischeri]|uniref:hypothetical protein n=1 Tax=Aliivibrio fischeri TaxID=668 RepID=UPI001F2B7803|nr:hypothetical protein [Aliivibrio fischeri]MCE4937454.1 hypothetical protein [Aliivibrio fischeri]
MKNWYPTYYYESQCWYRMSFLVNQTNYICESNSIYQSGCHFSCMAMILGVNPAYLANLLAVKGYFSIDCTGLMWDQNKPSIKDEQISIVKHHNKDGFQNSKSIKLIDIYSSDSLTKLEGVIQKYHQKDIHIIIGTKTHSLLVAGETDNSFYVWDPNTEIEKNESKAISNNVNGIYDLDWVFKHYKAKVLEIWVYKVT